MIAFVNNEFIEQEKAMLGISDLSIHRGYGIFDFFRTSNFVPLFLDNHLDRFFRSAAFLRLESLYTRLEIKKIIREMIGRNNMPDSGFKLILTGGYSPDGFQPVSSNFIILQMPVKLPNEAVFNKGLKIITYEYLRDLPSAKSINYLMGVYLQDKIQQQQADDVLYYKEGCVLEFPRSNVFIVTKSQTVITPQSDVLHGITRMKVLELASEKYETEEGIVSVEELKNAAEVFLTSSTKRGFPVLSVNNVLVGDGKPGPVTTDLYRSFIKMERSMLEKSAIF